MNTRLAVLVLLISSVGWGLTWLPLKSLNEMGLDGMHLIFIAFTSAAIFLSPWLIKDFSHWKHSLQLMLMIALAGGFANVTFQTAIYHGDVIRVMILFYMLPVWSVIGGRIFLQEKIDAMRLIAVLLCLAGAFVILDIWNTLWQTVNWIDFFALGAGLGLALTNILFRYTQHIPVRSKVASTFVGCSVMMVVVLMLSTTESVLPDNNAVPLAAAYGVFWLTLITFGTQWGVTQMEAGKSSIIIVMELVAAVVSVAILTSTDLKLHEMIGGIMVLSAAFLEGSRTEDETVKTLAKVD